MRIGVDAGGTFTDFVVMREDGRTESFKLRSNPAAPHEVILAGLDRIARSARAEVVHGSTVATNALLERKGARTAFITTAGFDELLEIGRQNRTRLYDLAPGPKRLLIDRTLTFGVEERTHADGSVESAPADDELRALRARLVEGGVESVAVCLLHAYRNPANEALVRRALDGVGYLSISHEICPEFREYERGCTTALNAYVGPLMARYLSHLAGGRRSFSILQSNGGSITLEEASGQAVRTILSGPAGGVVGAMSVAQASGYRKVLGFDMGGTSTDVSLIDVAPRETTEAYVDGLPVRVPMLEIHTVGAGGGSLARVDAGGLMRVGPESAGADPGPACYGKGDEPAVTDAHVVLGRISGTQLAGGSLPLFPDRSGAAIGAVGRRIRLSAEETAAGILRVVNATMARAIRVVSVERGYDAREFTLVAFGGCGGLHACEIAEELGIRRVLVPKLAGALSALGMLLADRVRDYAAGALGRRDYSSLWKALERQARRDLRGASLERTADLRYSGQSYELTVPWNGGDPAPGFHKLHRKTYGYANERSPVEIVALRLRSRTASQKPLLRERVALDPSPSGHRPVFTAGKWHDAALLRREQVGRDWLHGPALILDYGSTTVLPPSWRARRDTVSNLILERL
jgi:N-methylhydantoinase A